MVNFQNERLQLMDLQLQKLSREAEGLAELLDICCSKEFNSTVGIVNQIDINYRRRVAIAKRMKGMINSYDFNILKGILRSYHINPSHV